MDLTFSKTGVPPIAEPSKRRYPIAQIAMAAGFLLFFAVRYSGFKMPHNDVLGFIFLGVILSAFFGAVIWVIVSSIRGQLRPDEVVRSVLSDDLGFTLDPHINGVFLTAFPRPDSVPNGSYVRLMVFAQNATSAPRDVLLRIPSVTSGTIKLGLAPTEVAVFVATIYVLTDRKVDSAVIPIHFGGIGKPKGSGKFLSRDRRDFKVTGLKTPKPIVTVVHGISTNDQAEHDDYDLPELQWISLWQAGMREPRFDIMKRLTEYEPLEPIEG